jgi:hypothetical protein
VGGIYRNRCGRHHRHGADGGRDVLEAMTTSWAPILALNLPVDVRGLDRRRGGRR